MDKGATAQHVPRHLNNLGHEWSTRTRRLWSRENVQAV